MPRNGMRPIPPGEILREQLDALGVSANAFAAALSVPANRISGILNARRAISADTALRLSRFFGSTPQFWMNLQTAYDLRTTEEKSGERIMREVQSRSENVRTRPHRTSKKVA